MAKLLFYIIGIPVAAIIAFAYTYFIFKNLEKSEQKSDKFLWHNENDKII